MDTVVRIAVIYLFVLVGLRILGKREFGQLSPLELVSLLMIPEIVSQSLIGSDFSLTTGLTGVATLLVLVFATSLLVQRFQRVEHLVSGQPTLLVHQGSFIPEAMNRMRVTPDEVYTELHKAGLSDLAQVKWAILEPDGNIALVPTPAADADSPTPTRPTREKKV